MKHLHTLIGWICSLSFILVLLISSIECAVYGDMGFFEKEYQKYHVTDDVQMELEDLMEVTVEMMAYLRGDREDLHVPTIVNGEPREFFNEKEIAHMVDVRNLFLGGLRIRTLCLFLTVIGIGLLLLLKANLSKTLPKCMMAGTGCFFALLIGLAALISTNFTKYFVIFHHIFFTNDLWLLDPATDLLINIVPEPFFMDMALRIGITFAVFIAAFFCFALLWRSFTKKKENLLNV